MERVRGIEPTTSLAGGATHARVGRYWDAPVPFALVSTGCFRSHPEAAASRHRRGRKGNSCRPGKRG